MFELTRQEQAIVAGVIVIFLLGLGTMHWRNSESARSEIPAAAER